MSVSPQTSRAPQRFEGTACALALGESIFPPSRNQALRHVVCVLPVPFDIFVTLNLQFPPMDTSPSSVTYAEMVLITYQLSLPLLRGFFTYAIAFPLSGGRETLPREFRSRGGTHAQWERNKVPRMRPHRKPRPRRRNQICNAIAADRDPRCSAGLTYRLGPPSRRSRAPAGWRLPDTFQSGASLTS